MTIQTERLIAVLEARIDKFEKQMHRASGSAGREFQKITKAGDAMEARLAKLGMGLRNFGVGLLGGIAAGGVSGLVGQFQAVAKSVAMIGNEAKRAGVTVEVFQEWKFVAEQARIPVDSLIDGLKELNLRGDEFAVTGKGPAAEAFQRLGYGADELQRKLQNPSQLLLEIIDRLGKFDKAAQIRIADELFGGTGGERFVELLEQGEQGIRETIRQAHELGVVIDRDVIERAAELDRKFNAVTATVSSGLKTAIVEAAGALQAFIGAFDGMWQRYEQRRQTAELGDLAGSLVGPPGTKPPAGSGVRTTPKTDRLPKAEFIPPTSPPGGFGSGSAARGSGRDSAASAAEREAAAMRRLIADLEHELDIVGATDLEREISNTLRHAGAAATDDQRAKIVALVTALHAEAEASAAAADAAAELRDIGRDVLGSMVSDLRDGKAAADVLAGALDRIADRLVNLGMDWVFGGGLGRAGILGGAIIPGILHSGGVAGKDGYGHGRAVSPSVFAGARRYHKGGIAGLQAGEVPAILQRGEVVLPRGAVAGPAQQTSVVQVVLSPDLEARVLERAAGQSIQIVQASQPGTIRMATDAVHGRVRRQPGYLRG